MRKEEFFKFMQERHNIWYDRFILQNNPPWTTDHILATTKYTNVYRELDRNTVWFIQNIAEADIEEYVKVMMTFIYTLVNNPVTMETAGPIPISLEQIPSYIGGLEYAEVYSKRKGIPTFTNSYFIYPVAHGMPKLKAYIEKVIKPAFEDIESLVDVAIKGDPEEFMKYVTNYPGVGDFIGYEMYCNFALIDFVPFGFNDFVNIGPGALEGLYRVYGKEQVKAVKDKKSLLDSLQKEFPEFIESSKLNFHYLSEDKSVHLRVIEHSLCEFHKYCTQTDNPSGSRRIKYIPKTLDFSDYLVSYYQNLKLFI